MEEIEGEGEIERLIEGLIRDMKDQRWSGPVLEIRL